MDTIKEKLEVEMKARLDTIQVIETKDGKDLNFKEAMEIADRLIQIEKFENEQKEKEKNRRVEYIKIAATGGGIILGFMIDNYFLKKVCNFEKDYTFTTTPAKRLVGSIFRFRK